MSPFDGWWRGVSPADRILIENEVVTELQVTIYYEWEGTECDTVLSMSEPAELSDRRAVLFATSADAPGASFEVTLEFSDGPTGNIRIAELEYEGPATCSGQDATGDVSVVFGQREHLLYLWRAGHGPPIDFDRLGHQCDLEGCPHFAGDLPDDCGADAPENYWWINSGTCDGSDVTLACVGFQKDVKRCTKYCETDADCADAEVPMSCNTDCNDGPTLNTCVPLEDDGPC